ncbi:MAG TPA: polyphenol oxidase family protein [Acidimicrobiales bacterium]|nr:polyphenol oxidase family protein [Acidimicrobiales bacterium]
MNGPGPLPGAPANPLTLPGGGLACWTGRAEGDLGPGAADDPTGRRRAVLDRPWAWASQVHGAEVLVVGEDIPLGPPADALVSQTTGCALAVFTADCAPVALVSAEGPIGAVHAGWRGLQAGVVAAAVEAMRRLGAVEITAALGPCIHAECYEFSPAELTGLADLLGASVAGRTSEGALALDVPAAVAQALGKVGVELSYDMGVCTACSTQYWSHRRSGDRQRQAMIVWRT